MHRKKMSSPCTVCEHFSNNTALMGSRGGGGGGGGVHGLNAAQWLYLQFMILSDLRATDQGVHSECNHNMMYVNPLVI